MKIAYVVILLFLFSFAYAQTENSTTSDCTTKVQAELPTVLSSAKTKAIALATSSVNYTSMSSKQNYHFLDISYFWTVDQNTCNVILKNVKVIFVGRGLDPCCGETVTFVEDGSLTKIVSIDSGTSCSPFCAAGVTHPSVPEFSLPLPVLLISILFILMMSAKAQLKF